MHLQEIRIWNVSRSWNASFPAETFFLRIKEWELESMKVLVKQLELHMEEVYKLRLFLFVPDPEAWKGV